MAQQIYLNLPVADLQKSVEFFTALGFTFNPQFTDETAACMIISDTIFVMLATHDKFKQFTSKAICDARTSTEVLISLSCESRQAVDDLVVKALAAGGHTDNEPETHGDFMYSHDFQDLDGHNWGVMFMDTAKLPG